MKSRILTAFGVVVLALGGALVVAPSAAADTPIIWYQGVGRASASAPCPTTSAADSAAGWTEWTPSWEEWANDGTGGNVCTRSITWAYEAGVGGMQFPSADCILTFGVWYADFDGNYFLPPDSTDYSDSACATSHSFLTYGYVYAPEGPGQALTLCHLAFGVGVGVNGSFAPDVYQCDI